VVTTTDIHLPRRVGHALEHAYKGKLDVHYSEGAPGKAREILQAVAAHHA
jgi:hypothetical protein